LRIGPSTGGCHFGKDRNHPAVSDNGQKPTTIRQRLPQARRLSCSFSSPCLAHVETSPRLCISLRRDAGGRRHRLATNRSYFKRRSRVERVALLPDEKNTRHQRCCELRLVLITKSTFFRFWRKLGDGTIFSSLDWRIISPGWPYVNCYLSSIQQSHTFHPHYCVGLGYRIYDYEHRGAPS